MYLATWAQGASCPSSSPGLGKSRGLDNVDRLGAALKNIFTVNLGARPGEKVLVFTDLIPDGAAMDPVERTRRGGLVRVARAAADAGRALGLDVRYTEFEALGSHGTEPGEGLWRAAFGDEAVDALVKDGLLSSIRDKKAGEKEVREARRLVEGNRSAAAGAVVALTNYSTSHTRFRDLLTSVAGARYASMPLFEEDMLWGSMQADWDAVERRCARIAAAFKGGRSVRVTTGDGTDISFGIEGRPVMLDTGILREAGSFSNLPAGEVYMAPVEGTAEGMLVLQWAPNRRLSSPLKVRVEGGLAREVLGDEPYRKELEANLAKRPDNRNIAELGIGANDRASRPDNVLESEKIMGTIHIAFGDNSSMGGIVSTPFHQDFVYFGPTLVVRTEDGERTVIKEGWLLVEE